MLASRVSAKFFREHKDLLHAKGERDFGKFYETAFATAESTTTTGAESTTGAAAIVEAKHSWRQSDGFT